MYVVKNGSSVKNSIYFMVQNGKKQALFIFLYYLVLTNSGVKTDACLK